MLVPSRWYDEGDRSHSNVPSDMQEKLEILITIQYDLFPQIIDLVKFTEFPSRSSLMPHIIEMENLRLKRTLLGDELSDGHPDIILSMFSAFHNLQLEFAHYEEINRIVNQPTTGGLNYQPEKLIEVISQINILWDRINEL